MHPTHLSNCCNWLVQEVIIDEPKFVALQEVRFKKHQHQLSQVAHMAPDYVPMTRKSHNPDMLFKSTSRLHLTQNCFTPPIDLPQPWESHSLINQPLVSLNCMAHFQNQRKTKFLEGHCAGHMYCDG